MLHWAKCLRLFPARYATVPDITYPLGQIALRESCNLLLYANGSAGFLNVLRDLTTVGDISLQAFNERFDFMALRNDTYYVLVICDESAEVVGTGAVVVERKFIHGLGRSSSLGIKLASSFVDISRRPSWPYRGYRGRQEPTG